MIHRRNLLGLAALALASACASAPAPEAPAHQTYSAAAFFQTTSYGMSAPAGLGFSPDGSRILIWNDSSGVINAYALSIEGGTPQPLTTSTDNATFAVSYFPNDERVLVSADQGGDELDHIYVRERDGSLRDLTPGQNLKADFLAWRNDGRVFWITSNERDAQVFDL